MLRVNTKPPAGTPSDFTGTNNWAKGMTRGLLLSVFVACCPQPQYV